MILLGIDPGLSGAIAEWRPATGELVVHDMPTFQLTRGGKSKREIDLYALARIVDNLSAANLAVVELVGSMPGQGASSTFAFGKAAGIALMACAANFIPIEQVAPRTWKRAMLVADGKDGSRARASALLPKHAHLWQRVKDDGRAEAALMALHAERLFRQREVAA